MSMRVLIADDEPLARRRLRELLADDPEVEVVGECASGEAALAAVRAQAPDLVFLDIEMPGLDGLAVSAALGGERGPLVIFVTAYDQYAVKAFELRAVDYLLKPFDWERFDRALGRAKGQWRARQAPEASEQILALLGELKAPPRYLERLAIRSDGRVRLWRAEEIDWIEAEGNYVRVHAGKLSALVRETLSGLEARLDPRRFTRIHRSQIVNLDRIQELHPWSHHDYRVVLRDGTELTLSRSYRDRLAFLLGK
ncbi:MAG TPA: LytTR family DNA-binding domain-containing protein [Blastocatellia bacterium]|jgi:two-component system LytT family response regulator|nr:LytTR family DNA-binding domain-containing protein [Blastocatellia bacterium]